MIQVVEDNMYINDEIITEEEETITLTPSDELNALIVDGCKHLLEIDEEISQVRAKKNIVYDDLIKRGIPRQIMNEVLSSLRMTDEQRLARDTARMVTRSAVGIPMQVDMFD